MSPQVDPTHLFLLASSLRHTGTGKNKYVACLSLNGDDIAGFDGFGDCNEVCSKLTPLKFCIFNHYYINTMFPSSLYLLSVHEGCEQGSPPRLWCSDGRLSRSCSSDSQHTSPFGGGCVGGGGSDWPKKEAEENKENVRLDQCFSNTSGLPTDLDGWNDSVISGGLESLKL